MFPLFRISNVKIAITFCLSFAIINCFTQNPTQRIDSLLRFPQQENAFSGDVMLKKGDQILYHGTYNTITNGTQHYRVGSVSKMFTATIIYHLIEEGKLQLNTPLSTYYPQIKYAEEITIAQMLSHTSGIFSVTEWDDYYTTRAKVFSREQVLQIILDNKPTFKPGDDCSYSNSNYILLGYIAEDITGRSYSSLLEDFVLKPAHLQDTWYETMNPDRNKRELSYKFNGAEWIPDVDSDPSLPAGAGSIVSNTADLCTFMQAMFTNKLVSSSSLDTMRSLVSKSYGHGLILAPFYEHKGWGHTGRIDEFRAFAGYLPDDSIAFAVTSNGMTIDLNQIMIGVLSIYFGKEYRFPEFLHTDISTPAVNAFTGNYRAWFFGVIPVGKFTITEASPNYLYMWEQKTGPEGEKMLLTRTDSTTFHASDIDGDMVFELKKNGKVKKAHLIQGQVKIRCSTMRD